VSIAKLILVGSFASAPVLADEAVENEACLEECLAYSDGWSGDEEVVFAHPGRRPHPNPHRGHRRWMDGRRHGGHFGATARISFAYHQGPATLGGPTPLAIESVALGLEVRFGRQDSLSMSLLAAELSAGMELGYRRYVAGDFDRGLFVGANVGEWGVGVPDVPTYMFGEGVVGVKYTDRRGLTVELGTGAGMFISDRSDVLAQVFVAVGQSI